MTAPPIFDLCEPGQDVWETTIAGSAFTADLTQASRKDATPEYKAFARFFAKAHPIRGLEDLLRNVCLRLFEAPSRSRRASSG